MRKWVRVQDVVREAKKRLEYVNARCRRKRHFERDDQWGRYEISIRSFLKNDHKGLASSSVRNGHSLMRQINGRPLMPIQIDKKLSQSRSESISLNLVQGNLGKTTYRLLAEEQQSSSVWQATVGSEVSFGVGR